MPGEEDLRKSVVSSLKLLLTLQCAGLLLTLTAGVSLLAHVGQFSECLLFSYKGSKLATNYSNSSLFRWRKSVLRGGLLLRGGGVRSGGDRPHDDGDHVPHYQADHINLYCSKSLRPEEAEIPGHQRTDSPPPLTGVGRGDFLLCRNARKELGVVTGPPLHLARD